MNKKSKSLFVLLIIFISVGFAILTVNLNINGSVGFKSGNFDVHLENVVLEDSSIDDGSARIDGSTTINATGTLKKPGDFFNYSFCVVNAGTIEAQLDSLVKTTLSDSQKEIFNYTVTYALDNKEVKVNDVLYPGQVRKINVRFEYKYDVNELASPQQFDVNITMKYINPKKLSDSNVFDYEYSGTEQIFYVKKDGNYKLEVWGAQGGNAITAIGGYGGYSTGIVNLKKDDKLYINVGSMGVSSHDFATTSSNGSYNGGGSFSDTISDSRGAGGSATHIATTSGLLNTFSDKRQEVLIVAGGGGGAGTHISNDINDGGAGGGFEGNSGVGRDGKSGGYGSGGTQEAGGINAYDEHFAPASFGQGCSKREWSVAGGGGGYYGGGCGFSCASSAGGGSGYIGNSLLTNKAMYCYKCKTSTEQDTMTYSVDDYSNSPISSYAKVGNGHARITYLG